MALVIYTVALGILLMTLLKLTSLPQWSQGFICGSLQMMFYYLNLFKKEIFK